MCHNIHTSIHCATLAYEHKRANARRRRIVWWPWRIAVQSRTSIAFGPAEPKSCVASVLSHTVVPIPICLSDDPVNQCRCVSALRCCEKKNTLTRTNRNHKGGPRIHFDQQRERKKTNPLFLRQTVAHRCHVWEWPRSVASLCIANQVRAAENKFKPRSASESFHTCVAITV